MMFSFIILRPQRSTRTDTLFPATPLVRSRADREKRKDKPAAQRKSAESAKPSGLAERIADRAFSAASFMDRWDTSLLVRSSHLGADRPAGLAASSAPHTALQPSDAAHHDHSSRTEHRGAAIEGDRP